MEMMIRTTGVVTGKNAAGYFIQDGHGPWNGMYIYDSGNQVNIGDSVSMTGKVKEYFNFTELTSVTGFVKHAAGVALPSAAFIPVGSVKSEAYESVLVTVSNVTCKSTNAGYGMWSVVQGNDTCKVDTFLYKFTPALNAHYDITAVVNYGFSEFRLSPRSAADVQIASGIDDVTAELKISIYPNPTSGNISLSSEVSMTGIRVYTLTGVLVMSEHLNTKQAELTLEQLAKGMYLLQVDFSDNTSTSTKISVQ
jgi:predicted extracellular nuclease